MPEREFDIVLLGATGFTGWLTAEYLAGKARQESLKWAVAGRSKEKLNHLKAHLGQTFSQEPEIILADVADEASLQSMAKRARAVITTVGPYMRYGEPVVKACAENGTHYVDLTGEPEFVYKMMARYHETARNQGACIVPCCGFDSIPHDLGAFFAVQELNKRTGGGEPIRLKGYVQAAGAISGGTWHSALGIIGNLQEGQRARKQVAHYLKPAPESGRRVGSDALKPFRNPVLDGWACPLPTIDPEIIRYSAASLEDYGPDFQYGHYALVRRLPVMVGGIVGIGAIAGLAQFKVTRNILGTLIKPGEGPSPEARAKNWFKVTMVGDSGAEHVVCTVSGGDPGYGETSKMLAESALCLALDQDRPACKGGVVTTAMAMGNALIRRLNQSGILFEVVE